MQKRQKLGIIFDMDGVVVHSMPYHDRAWKTLLANYGIRVNTATLRKTYGRVNEEILKHFFGRRLTRKKREAMALEKEATYQELFRRNIKATKGLPWFLKELKRLKIPTALATAAPPENVDYVLGATNLKKYFSKIVDASHVRRGKPDPEVFLKAAKAIKVSPAHCIVFEDALHGIEAARRAGMKVVAVATTHAKKELSHADWVVNNFRGVTISGLRKLERNTGKGSRSR